MEGWSRLPKGVEKWTAWGRKGPGRRREVAARDTWKGAATSGAPPGAPRQAPAPSRPARRPHPHRPRPLRQFTTPLPLLVLRVTAGPDPASHRARAGRAGPAADGRAGREVPAGRVIRRAVEPAVSMGEDAVLMGEDAVGFIRRTHRGCGEPAAPSPTLASERRRSPHAVTRRCPPAPCSPVPAAVRIPSADRSDPAP